MSEVVRAIRQKLFYSSKQYTFRSCQSLLKNKPSTKRGHCAQGMSFVDARGSEKRIERGPGQKSLAIFSGALRPTEIHVDVNFVVCFRTGNIIEIEDRAATSTRPNAAPSRIVGGIFALESWFAGVTLHVKKGTKGGGESTGFKWALMSCRDLRDSLDIGTVAGVKHLLT